MRLPRFVLLALSALALSVPSGLAAQYSQNWGVPGSPTGEAVAMVLEMIDRGDPAFVRAALGERFSADFVDSHPMEDHLGIFASLHEQMPGIRPGGVERTSAGARFTASSADSAVTLTFDLEVDGDGVITSMNVQG